MDHIWSIAITSGVTSTLIFTVGYFLINKYIINIISLNEGNNLHKHYMESIIKAKIWEAEEESKGDKRRDFTIWGFHSFKEFIDSKIYDFKKVPKCLHNDIYSCKRSTEKLERAIIKLRYKNIFDTIKDFNPNIPNMYFSEHPDMLYIPNYLMTNLILSSGRLQKDIQKYKDRLIKRVGILLIVGIVILNIYIHLGT